MASNKAAWIAELRQLLAVSQAPCCLVECDGNFQAATQSGQSLQLGQARAPPLRERFVCANSSWHRLLEYEDRDVAGRSFSEIRGFQGQLTTDSSKLKLGSLLITKETCVEDLKVVNYTGRTKRPVELEVRVNIIKHRGRNVFFMCSIASHREIMALGGPRSVHPAPTEMMRSLEEPEPEEMPADELEQERANSWQAAVAHRMGTETRPCVLVTCNRLDADGSRPAMLREQVSRANAAWYNMYEYEASDVAQRSFSEIPGFQGPLTSDSSILRFGSLMISKESEIDGLKIVNYTGRRRRPIEATLHIDIFGENGANAALLCTVTAAAEVLDIHRVYEPSRPFEEEPEGLDADSNWSRQSSEDVAHVCDPVWSRQTTEASQAGREDAYGGCGDGLRQHSVSTA